jgi:hypothetical protein
MDEKYNKGDYKNGKGFLVENTPEGPMYKYEEAWVSPLVHKVAKNLAEHWGVSEKVVISKMAEQYVARTCTLEDRLFLYKEEVLPALVEKAKKRNGSREDIGEKVWPK